MELMSIDHDTQTRNRRRKPVPENLCYEPARKYSIVLFVTENRYQKQEAQLLQRDRSALRVTEYFPKSQGHTRSFEIDTVE